MRILAVSVLAGVLIYPAMGQSPADVPPAQVVQEVRDYRMDNEDRIVRELAEFLSIPNVASDTANIQKNAARLVEMLEARGIETHLLPIEGRGPVVFGKLIVPEGTHTVIFYAHYDGQSVDAAAWTDGTPFKPVLRSDAIEAGGKRIPFPENSAKEPAVYQDNWRIYARSASDDKSPIVALLAALDALRAKVECVEEPQFTRDYHDPEKRSIANALTIEFRDGTKTDEIIVEYPIGHKRRRAEGMPLLVDKFRRNLARRFGVERQERILAASLDQAKLEQMAVTEYVGLYIPS